MYDRAENTISRYCPRNCLKRLRKTTEHLDQDSSSPDRHPNLLLPNTEQGRQTICRNVLYVRLQSHGTITCIMYVILFLKAIIQFRPTKMKEPTQNYNKYLKDDSLLGCCAVEPRRNLPTFRRCLLPHHIEDGDSITCETSVNI
jgi:hypothetical protein